MRDSVDSELVRPVEKYLVLFRIFINSRSKKPHKFANSAVLLDQSLALILLDKGGESKISATKRNSEGKWQNLITFESFNPLFYFCTALIKHRTKGMKARCIGLRSIREEGVVLITHKHNASSHYSMIYNHVGSHVPHCKQSDVQ